MTWRTPDKLLEKGFDSYCTEVFTHSVLSALSASSSWNPSISKLIGLIGSSFLELRRGTIVKASMAQEFVQLCFCDCGDLLW